MTYSLWSDFLHVTWRFILSLLCLSVLLTGCASDSLPVLGTGAEVKRTIQRQGAREE